MRRGLPGLAVLALALAVGGCGGSAPPGPVTAPVTATATVTATTTSPATAAGATAAPRAHRRRRRPVDPGTLPQTAAQPSASTRRFRAEMRALFAAVRDGRPHEGRRAFFPAAAYVQLKAVGDPLGDFRGRLLARYALDIAAAHALLAGEPGGARRARLLRVDAPAGLAHLVGPDVCANRDGYWELPNARVVYRGSDGVERSFGIASLISWRGVWYVVHLGAVVPSSSAGEVDRPAAGPGTPQPSSTC